MDLSSFVVVDKKKFMDIILLLYLGENGSLHDAKCYLFKALIELLE